MVDAQQQPKKRKPGRPSRSSNAARDDIKCAALSEFARCGFQSARLDNIARAAGVAKPLIHYHFGSKADLWTAAVTEEFADFEDQAMGFDKGLAGLDPMDFADVFADRMVRFAAAHRSLIQILLDENRQGGNRSEWIFNQFHVRISRVMNGYFDEVLSTVETRRYLSHMLPSIFGAIAFPFLDADIVEVTYERDVFSEEYIAEQSAFVAMLLRASIQETTRDRTLGT